MDTYKKTFDVQRYLEFGPLFPARFCRILQTFEGKLGEGFSNSCTMLIELVGETSNPFQEHQRVVLKVFDSNLCQTLRNAHEASHLTFQKTGIETVDQKEEKKSFYTWLEEKLAVVHLQDDRIRMMIRDDLLPAQPTYGNVVRQSLSIPYFGNELVRKGITRVLSPREHHLLVEHSCLLSFRHEKSVLSHFSKNDSSRTLPLLLDSTEIMSSFTSILDDGNKIFVNSHALVIEYIDGITLAQWVEKNVKKLWSHKQKNSASFQQDVSDICKGCITANAIPLIFGFQYSDIRPDNYMICRDPQSNRIKVRLLDAGSVLFVQEAHHCDDRCVLNRVADGKILCRLAKPQAFYFTIPSFTFTHDTLMNDLLQGSFGEHFMIDGCSTITAYSLDQFSQLDESWDITFWQVVNQGLWRFTDRKLAIRKLPYTIEVLRAAHEIMRQTMERERGHQRWVWSALPIIVALFCGYKVRPVAELEKFTTIFTQSVSAAATYLDDATIDSAAFGDVVDDILSRTTLFVHQPWRDNDDDQVDEYTRALNSELARQSGLLYRSMESGKGSLRYDSRSDYEIIGDLSGVPSQTSYNSSGSIVGI